MKTKVRKMKKIKWITVGVILLVAGVICWNYIVKNERDKKYPVERYIEQEEEKQQDNTTVASNTDSDAALDNSHNFITYICYTICISRIRCYIYCTYCCCKYHRCSH